MLVQLHLFTLSGALCGQKCSIQKGYLGLDVLRRCSLSQTFFKQRHAGVT